jgi:hypothetical protein
MANSKRVEIPACIFTETGFSHLDFIKKHPAIENLVPANEYFMPNELTIYDVPMDVLLVNTDTFKQVKKEILDILAQNQAVVKQAKEEKALLQKAIDELKTETLKAEGAIPQASNETIFQGHVKTADELYNQFHVELPRGKNGLPV